MRILSKDLQLHEGKIVELKGWVHRVRDLGGVSFVMLRDRKAIVQLVFKDKPDFTLESVISAKGLVHANEKAQGGFELQVEEFEVLGEALPDLPIQVNQDPENIGIEAILDNRMLSLRNPKIKSIFRLQAGIVQYFAEYLRSQDFTEIKTTKLQSTGAEGGSGLFEVDYFDTKMFLAQSPQLYKQAMVASGMERVFEIGAAYRAEKHDTPRHLNEYVSLDVEMGFIKDETELMDLEANILKYVFQKVKEHHADDLAVWNADAPDPDAVDKIPRITYDEAKKKISEILGRRVFDLNPEGERVICEWAKEEYGISAVFVTAFPRKGRPFYTYPEGIKTRSFDLLFRGLEITTGGQRIHQYKMLKEVLPKFKLTEEGLGGYMEVFKYGCPPHGGFAIGLERITQKILGLQNIKECSLFPRSRNRIAP